MRPLEKDRLGGETFAVAWTKARSARRMEQGMLLKFADHLRSQNHRITARLYQYHRGGPRLRCDLLDETDHVLYEAKGGVPPCREDVQKGIGQLFTYKQAEVASGASGMRVDKLVMLLPCKLDPFMAATLESAGIGMVVWPNENEDEDKEAARFWWADNWGA